MCRVSGRQIARALVAEKTGREVVSPELHEAVMVFQAQVDIRANGALDFATLKSAAGVSTITGFVLKPGIVQQ